MSSAREEDLAGQTLDGRWTVGVRIGAGGMGTVWRAEDRDGTVVAIKALRAEMLQTEDLFKRFAQEATAASRIGDAHIVKVLGFGYTPSKAPFYAMEFCDGPDLLAVLRADGPMPWQRAFAIAEQICAALFAAHTAGIIHRDVKPENFVLIEREAEHGRDLVKVLDFGIAKLMDPDLAEVETRTGVSIGTPEYMAPEQAEGIELDGRVDVYGVGILLYQLVTGKVPFSGSDEFEVMQRHMSEVPPPPSDTGVKLPKIVDAVILQALEKDREHRYADMQRFARSLNSARERDLSGTIVESEPDEVEPSPRKLPWVAIALASVAIAVTIAWALSS